MLEDLEQLKGPISPHLKTIQAARFLELEISRPLVAHPSKFSITPLLLSHRKLLFPYLFKRLGIVCWMAQGIQWRNKNASQDTEIQTSKTWIRRCESCTAAVRAHSTELDTPSVKDAFGKEKNISGGYTFNASLESFRGQAKYIKLEKLFADAAFLTETQSEVCKADNTCLSPQSHIPNQRFSSPLSSIELPTRIKSGLTKNDIDRHQQEQNECEDQEQKELQLCDEIIESVCGGDYNEDNPDFELDEMDDFVCGFSWKPTTSLFARPTNKEMIKRPRTQLKRLPQFLRSRKESIKS
ncbi:hypothetical protein BY996DRAFT_6504504 [Phakopsora pachyrhizi]|nr:hypothetical protein BY996DRAFT_6504504 [Phakopsora pachyrhizi]